MRVLFDTNVVLDLLLARRPHLEVAAQLFNLVDRGVIQGVLCATTITTVQYMAAKAVGRARARKHIHELLEMFEVAAVDRTVLERAQGLEFKDYEDAVLHEAARAANVGGIVTRNGGDFQRAETAVFEPGRLLAAVLATQERDR